MLLLVPLLLGCMGRLGPPPALPATVGKHPVGVTHLEVEDERRDRKLDVEVWYPAARVDTMSDPVVYEIEALGGTVARLRSPTGAHRDAPPARAAGPLPVVLLSHGAGSSRFANMSLSEVLASHGYVVAAPDHKGHTVAAGVWGISDSERAQSALDRPLDLSAVLDDLERRSRGRDPIFHGLLDMDRVAVAGHSFGGRSALGLVGAQFDIDRQRRECAANGDDRRCRALSIFSGGTNAKRYRYRDPRIKAALVIAPAGFEFYRADGIARVDAPVLIVGARLDKTTPFAERHKPLYDSLTSQRYLLDLKRAGHLTATDVCDIVESIGFFGKTFGGDKSRDGCGEGYLSRRRALEMVSDASLAFLDVFLNEIPGATARLESALEAPESRTIATRKLAKDAEL